MFITFLVKPVMTYYDSIGVNAYATVFTDIPAYNVIRYTTKYQTTFTVYSNVAASVLLVGGGGGGGRFVGGGGGAGAVVFYPNASLNVGTQTISVGYSGPGGIITGSDFASAGGDTFIKYSSQYTFLARGGGGGGYAYYHYSYAGGGSGGGTGGYSDTVLPGTNIGSGNIVNSVTDQGQGVYIYDNKGGSCSASTVFDSSCFGGGGGGAGGPGYSTYPAYGGIGIYNATINGITYDFETIFGNAYRSVAQICNGKYYIAGGGAGAAASFPSYDPAKNSTAGCGGGGSAGYYVSTTSTLYNVVDPMPNTGGGGSGASNGAFYGGNGATGLLLIKYFVGVTCGSGTIPDSSGLICTACTSGTYASGTGMSVCTGCYNGKYSTIAGLTTVTGCVQCQAGTYSLGSASVCVQCAPGTYGITVGGGNSGVCTTCFSGFYSSSIGGTVCTACPAGTTSPIMSTSISQCTCPYGYFVNSSVCTICTSNYYCVGNIQYPCPSNTTSVSGAGSIQNCKCSAGYQCSLKRDILINTRFNTDIPSFQSIQSSIQQQLYTLTGVPVYAVNYSL